MRFTTFATILLVSPLISASVVTLNDADFTEKTTGKVAFVKFFAPWCGHCKEMASDWEQLADDFKSNPDILIAEVDCTSDDSETVCADQGVEGFPTLKYGDSAWMESYDGERDYDSLSTFAKEGLKKSCSPANSDLCSAEQKAKIDKYMDMTFEELQEILKKLDAELEEDESAFDETTDVLEEEYTEFSAAADDAKRDAKRDINYNMLKAIQSARSAQNVEL